jgi:hypothetical protein
MYLILRKKQEYMISYQLCSYFLDVLIRHLYLVLFSIKTSSMNTSFCSLSFIIEGRMIIIMMFLDINMWVDKNNGFTKSSPQNVTIFQFLCRIPLREEKGRIADNMALSLPFITWSYSRNSCKFIISI